MLDVFEECRERIPAQQAAEFYGLEIDRAGRARCCFHSPDRHPSMTFKGSAFRCWSCGAHGSSIDLTAQIFSLSPLDAVKKLSTDFMLGLELDKPPNTATVAADQHRQEVRQTFEMFERWRGDMLQQLTVCFREGHLALQSLETPADLDKLTDAQALAIREQARFEWLADALTSGDMKQMMDVFRQREGVGRLCNRVLKNLPTRSSAA